MLAIWLTSDGPHPVLITIRILKSNPSQHYPKEGGVENSLKMPGFRPAPQPLIPYRNRLLGRLPKRAITNWKLEDAATHLNGLGVPITGFDAPQVSQIRCRNRRLNVSAKLPDSFQSCTTFSFNHEILHLGFSWSLDPENSGSKHITY